MIRQVIADWHKHWIETRGKSHVMSLDVACMCKTYVMSASMIRQML